MYIKDENDFAILKRAEDIIGEEFKWQINDDDFKGFVDENEFEIIDELCSEIDRLKEELDDQKEYYENQIKDYYNKKSPYEIYGINEDMFH